MVGDNFWNFWWGFSMFCGKIVKCMPCSGWSWAYGPKWIRFLDSTPPKTPKPVTNFKSQKSCMPMSFLNYDLLVESARKIERTSRESRHVERIWWGRWKFFYFGDVVEKIFFLTSNHWITNDKELNSLKGRIFTVTILSAEINTLRGFRDLHRQHTYMVGWKAALVGKRFRQKRLRTTVSKHGRIKDGHLP